jgi:hypothetical protein
MAKKDGITFIKTHFTQGKPVGGKAKYDEFIKFEFLLVVKNSYCDF